MIISISFVNKQTSMAEFTSTALSSKREKFFFYNSLLCLVDACNNHYTTVDLRNESYVYGKVDQVDGFMNISMVDATFTNSRGENHKFDNFFIHSRNIRYVHIPEELPITSTIEKQLKKFDRKPQKSIKFQDTLKGKRFMAREKETIRRVMEMKESSSKLS